MAAITSLHVKYGAPIPEPRFEIVPGPPVNPGLSTHVWCKRGPENPLASVLLLTGDSPVPDGFLKLNRNLQHGTPNKVYICVRRWSPEDAKPPLGDVKFASTEDRAAAVEEGYEVLEPAVDSERGLWLCVRPLPAGEAPFVFTCGPGLDESKSRVGDLCEYLDTEGRWRVCKVASVTPTTVAVKAIWGPNHHRVTVQKGEGRLAEVGRYTHETLYVDQGMYRIVPGFPFTALGDALDRVWTESESVSTQELDKLQLYDTVELLMKSACDPDVADSVYELLKKAIKVVIRAMSSPGPLALETVSTFERLFLVDDSCNYFTTHYGAVRPDQLGPRLSDWNGKWVKLPEAGASKYYVGSVNLFGDCGGFDLMTQRLESGFADACEVLAQGDVLWVAKWSGEKQLHDDVLLSWVTAVLRWLQSLDDDKLQEYCEKLYYHMVERTYFAEETLRKSFGWGPLLKVWHQRMEELSLCITARCLAGATNALKLQVGLRGLEFTSVLLRRLLRTDASPLPVGTPPLLNRPLLHVDLEMYSEFVRGEKVIALLCDLAPSESSTNVVMTATTAAMLVDLGRLGLVCRDGLQVAMMACPSATDTPEKELRRSVLYNICTNLSSESVSYVIEWAASSSSSVTLRLSVLAVVLNTLQKRTDLPDEFLHKLIVTGVCSLWQVLQAAADPSVLNFSSVIDFIFTDVPNPSGVLLAEMVNQAVTLVPTASLANLSLHALEKCLEFVRREKGFGSAVVNVRLGREVLDVVFAELSGYVQFARALAHRLGIVDRSSTTAGVAFIGAHTHHCSLDLRVGVLFDLWLALWFQNQDHELIADAVNIVTKVFNLLVLPVVSVTDEECCYELVQGFIRAVSKDLKLTAALELVGKMSSAIFLNLHTITTLPLTYPLWLTVSTSFSTLNTLRGRLLDGVLLDDSLVGLDVLWYFAMESEVASVCEDARASLVKLYKFRESTDMVVKVSLLAKCVDECLSRLAAELASSSPVDRRIESCFELLMSLLEAHEFSPAGAGSMDVAKDYVIGWSVTFGYSGGPIQKTILMPANPTVGQLRWAAGNAIGYPANKIRVLTKSKGDVLSATSWDHYPHIAAGIPFGQLHVIPCIKVFPDTETDPLSVLPSSRLTPERSAIVSLLCEPKRLVTIAHAVSKKKGYSLLAWSLLQQVECSASTLATALEVPCPTADAPLTARIAMELFASSTRLLTSSAQAIASPPSKQALEAKIKQLEARLAALPPP